MTHDLAAPGDPLVHGTARIIEAEDLGNAVPDREVTMRQRVLPTLADIEVRRQLKEDDLPEPDYQRQAALAAIVGLRLMGADNLLMSYILNTTPEQIEKMLESAPAQKTFELVFKTLISGNAASIQGRISAHADDALTTVVELMEDKDTRADVRLKAAQDVLDRSGTNADQFFADEADNNRNDDELRIVIMDEGGEERVAVEVGKKGR